MTDHLILSTIVLAVALLAAGLLPLTARTRYAVILCGIAKFAIPTAVFPFFPAEVLPAPLRTLGGGTPAAVTQATTTPINWLAVTWATIATLLFARWLLLRSRTISAALRTPCAASPRERNAVREARATMRIRIAIDAIRSPICEAPAVLRIVRPVIALPAHGCDELTDDELRSLVLHECAHVARHDNLGAVLQALATSLLWFHPLVWIASRSLTITREEACDETVADAMQQTDAYVSALTKICRAIVAPRTAGASCMASAKIKERMEHLMSYQTIRAKAWSHRAMLSIAIVLLGFSTIATATSSSSQPEKYDLKFTVDPAGRTALQFEVTVTEIATGKIVMQPRIKTAPGTLATAMTDEDSQRQITVSVLGNPDNSGKVTLDVQENGDVVQHTVLDYAPGAAPRKYTGEPVSMKLKDADIRDVLNTFGDLTGMKFEIAADVSGSVTIDVAGVPWDQMLDIVLTQNNLVAEIEGNTIRVKRK